MPSEERCNQFLSDEVLFLFVIGVYRHGFACAEEFRPCRRNQDVIILAAVGNHEFDVIEFVDIVLVFDFRICESGHTSGTPVDRVVSFVNKTSVEEFHEG